MRFLPSIPSRISVVAVRGAFQPQRGLSTKPKMRAHNILAMKHTGVLAMPQTVTVAEAISNMAVHNHSSALVVNDKNEVEGIFTSRDLLRYLHFGRGRGQKAQPLSDKLDHKADMMKAILDLPIQTLVTRKEKMVYCTLTDTARRIREIMFQLKIRNIPVVDNGAVVGIISIKDLADSSFSLEDTGGKKGYMNNIIGRMGLPPSTGVRDLTNADGQVLLSNSVVERESRWDIDGNIDILDPISMIMDGEKVTDETVQHMYTKAVLNNNKIKVPRNKVEMASFALPHPYKDRERGVTENRRALGMDKELCTDNSLNADAHFVCVVPVSNNTNVYSQVYACVADGVGSWIQYGVDPRDFAHQLVRNVKWAIKNNAAVSEDDNDKKDGNLYEKAKSLISNILPRTGISSKEVEENRVEIVDAVLVNMMTGEVNNEIEVPTLTDAERAEVTQPMTLSRADAEAAAERGVELGIRGNDPIHPLDAILDAWNATLSDHVVGSSTICVATIDTSLNQLSYSNLGDGGLLVVRPSGAGTAGFMKDTGSDEGRKSKMSLSYLSQQQLRSFNLPYQLGYSGNVDYGGSFENPIDADTASIPVLPGDIIIMATDGLFDNLDLNEIVSEVQDWEEKHFSAENTIAMAHPADVVPVQDLAKRLVLKARDASIDQQKDSPFALLAKENDILWSGGMPDDTTVVVMRVLKS